MSTEPGCCRRLADALPNSLPVRLMALVFTLSLGVSSFAQGEDAGSPSGSPVKDAVMKSTKDGGLSFRIIDVGPGKGQICIVCGDAIDKDQRCVVLQFRGRNVTVNEVLLEKWRADPDKYFRKLQTRGALFDESSVMSDKVGGTPSWVWLLIGIYILAGLMMGGACSYIAVTRGHDPMPWFLKGMFLNGIAMVMLLSKGQGNVPAIAGMPGGLSKVPDTHTPLPCPKCGATNHPSADSCSGCGATMFPSMQSEVARRET